MGCTPKDQFVHLNSHGICSLHLTPVSCFLLPREGDGANDVSMIQVADIGIGVSGQEGMQVSPYASSYHDRLPTKGTSLIKLQWDSGAVG